MNLVEKDGNGEDHCYSTHVCLQNTPENKTHAEVVSTLPCTKLPRQNEAGWYSQSGSDLLPSTFHLLHFREERRGEAWSTWFTCQTSIIVQPASSWLVPQRVLNWETGVVFSWPMWKNFLAMVPAMNFIQHCWLENLLESLGNLITLSLHSLI